MMVDTRTRDPVSAVREMLKWEASLRDVFASRFGRFAHGWSPDFEVRESHVAIRFIADVPGVRPEDLELRVDESRLVITGRREPESRTDDVSSPPSSHRNVRRVAVFSRIRTEADRLSVSRNTVKMTGRIVFILLFVPSA